MSVKHKTRPRIFPNILRASEAIKDSKAKAKILIIGDSGSGKTWLAASSSKPLIILTEANGAVSAVNSNPEALIYQCNSAEDLREIITQAMKGSIQVSEEEFVEFDTLIIDSLTEVQRLIKQEILESSKRQEFSIKDWGTLADRMRRFIRAVRDVPAHVVCTALSEVTNANDDTRYVGPMFEGKKTGNEIMQFFSAVGFLYRSQKAGSGDDSNTIVRKLMFDGPDNYMCKPCHGLEAIIEEPNMSKIIDNVNKTINNQIG